MFVSLLTTLAVTLVVQDPEKPDENVNLREVERAAMIYRIEIYNRYRLQRPLYNQYRAKSDELLQKFTDCDQTDFATDETVDWYRRAGQTVAGATNRLPAFPILPERTEPVVHVYGEEESADDNSDENSDENSDAEKSTDENASDENTGDEKNTEEISASDAVQSTEDETESPANGEQGESKFPVDDHSQINDVAPAAVETESNKNPMENTELELPPIDGAVETDEAGKVSAETGANKLLEIEEADADNSHTDDAKANSAETDLLDDLDDSNTSGNNQFDAPPSMELEKSESLDVAP